MIHDQVIIRKEFQPGQKVLFYSSRLHVFLGKLRSHWTGPYIVHKVHPHGAVEVRNATDGATFQLNGYHLKYREYLSPEVEKIVLDSSSSGTIYLLHCNMLCIHSYIEDTR